MEGSGFQITQDSNLVTHFDEKMRFDEKNAKWQMEIFDLFFSFGMSSDVLAFKVSVLESEFEF